LSTVTRPLPRPVRLLNAVGRRVGERGPLGLLDPDHLLAEARRRSGLTDLGPDTDEGFRRLVASLDREAGLTPLGRVVFGSTLRDFLVQRLRVVEILRQRPELAAAPVRRPLFVVGLSRTGTTLLYNLLARAEGARPLRGYEAADPLPPVLRGASRDLRAARLGLSLRGLHYLAPELLAVHEISNSGPEEDLQLLGRSLASFVSLQLADVPSYERWVWAQPPEAFVPTYELHRMQLRTLQADGRPGWWVLKCGAHLNMLEALCAVYPDAAVVQTHRDPAKVLGSLSSMVSINRRMLAQDHDPRAVGAQVVARTERTIARMADTRAALDGDRVLDVRYADLLTDPVAVVRAVHERFGYPFTAASEARVRAWLAANPRGKHGAHRYALEQFGLDLVEVERFAAPYRERYGIPREGPASEVHP